MKGRQSLVEQVWKETPDGRRPPGCPKKRRKNQDLIDMNRKTAKEED